MKMKMPMPIRVAEDDVTRLDHTGTALHFPLSLVAEDVMVEPATVTNPATLTKPKQSPAGGQWAVNSNRNQTRHSEDHCQSSSVEPATSHHRHHSTATIITTRTLSSRLPETATVPRPSSSPAPSSSTSLGSSIHFSTPSSSSQNFHLHSHTGTSVADFRPSAIRRPPASRSSHGIETRSGPPPALSTQRSYTTESTRRQQTPADLVVTRPQLKPRSKTETGASPAAQGSPPPSSNASPELLTRMVDTRGRAVKTERKMTRNQTRSSLDDDEDQTVRNLEGSVKLAEADSTMDSQSEERSGTSNEDLFLNLARSDSLMDETAESFSKNERMRSRIGVLNSQHPHTPQTTSFPRPSSSGRHVPRHSISSSQDAASFRWSPSGQTESTNVPSFIRSPSSKGRSYAASAHPLDQGNRDSQPALGSNVHLPPSRMRSGSNRETSPELSAIYGRRQSVHEPSPGLAQRAYKQSNLSYSTNSPYTSSPFAKSATNNIDHGRRPQVHAEDTESTISTTAPSTIWDDVEDLKHRMKKLELTGRLPSTSGAAISSVFGERPPTASTTMTTISSSPKHNRVNSTSPEASTIKGLEITQLHPLLKTALRRSKAVIDPDLYKTLEATVADALTLAAMTGSVAGSDISQSPVSIVGIERRIRRKADGMCRGLTELCIALTEKSQSTLSQSLSPAVNKNRAISLHQSIEGGQEPRFLRASTEEPELRSSSRAMSRLEARRSSMLASNTSLSRRDTPRGSTPASSFDVAVSGPNRSSSTRQIQRNANADGEQNTSARPMSRAMVETTRLRPSPSHRTSREYTSQHPLPNPTQRSPSMQSSLPVRRNHFSPPTQSQPSTPNIYSGNRRHLDRTTPPSASDNARIAEMRRQRIASLGQFTTGSIGSGKQAMGADDDTPP